MVGTRTDAIRRIPSARCFEATPSLMGRLFGRSSNFAIIPSTAGKEIQADKSNDTDLIGEPLPKLSTKPSSGRKNRKPKQANPQINRTYHSVLRPLRHARYLHVMP
jgi:hypothetical protein